MWLNANCMQSHNRWVEYVEYVAQTDLWNDVSITIYSKIFTDKCYASFKNKYKGVN